MATKKVYPFITAKMFDITDSIDGMNVVFDAREVESYQYWTLDDDDKDESVKVNFSPAMICTCTWHSIRRFILERISLR